MPPLLKELREKSPSWESDSQLAKKCIALYGTWRFIALGTETRYWKSSQANWIQSKPSRPISLQYIFILSSHLYRPTLSLLPWSFPTETFLFSCYPYVLRFALISLSLFCHPNTIRRKESISNQLITYFFRLLASRLFCPNISSTPCPLTLSVTSFL
jgi:hypothetical protein